MLVIILIIIVFLTASKFGQNIWQAAFALPNLLPENKFRPLDLFTRKPNVESIKIPYGNESLEADLYLPRNLNKIDKVLLAIHGANEQGKDDPRIVNFGQTFAETGIAALIPTFPSITREKFTPQAVDEIEAAYSWLKQKYPDKKSGMVGFSVAAGPMFIAAAAPQINERINYLISFGGYYELREILRNVTTGENRDSFGRELISQQYAKLFGQDESLNNLLNNTDPGKFDELYGSLSPEIKKFVEDLTPANRLNGLKAEKTFLVHSEQDYIVPTSESFKLKQALGQKSELTILRSFSHVRVQLPKFTFKTLASYYVPEAAKLYSLIFKILNF